MTEAEKRQIAWEQMKEQIERTSSGLRLPSNESLIRDLMPPPAMETDIGLIFAYMTAGLDK